jgi:hypothetical protein
MGMRQGSRRGGPDSDRSVRGGLTPLAEALRLYDENGLLPSARVNGDSGYRYYRLEQLRTTPSRAVGPRMGRELAGRPREIYREERDWEVAWPIR